MKARAARILALALALVQLGTAPAYAYDLGIGRENSGVPGMTSEYIYRRGAEDTLISVYLLGAVAKPGLYHVPLSTDLVSLLALAGGASSGAETSEIRVKRQAPAADGRRDLRFDLESYVRSDSDPKFTLSSNDLVYVTPGKQPVTGAVLTVIGIVSGVLGIVATGYLISRTARD